MLVHNIIILVIVDVIRQYLNTSNHKRKFILFLVEKSLGKKIVCLSVRRIKKTFPIENTEISVFVLNDGSVVVGGWSASPTRSKEHAFGVKKTFLIF
jgi:hypothetical protein